MMGMGSGILPIQAWSLTITSHAINMIMINLQSCNPNPCMHIPYRLKYLNNVSFYFFNSKSPHLLISGTTSFIIGNSSVLASTLVSYDPNQKSKHKIRNWPICKYLELEDEVIVFRSFFRFNVTSRENRGRLEECRHML